MAFCFVNVSLCSFPNESEGYVTCKTSQFFEYINRAVLRIQKLEQTFVNPLIFRHFA